MNREGLLVHPVPAYLSLWAVIAGLISYSISKRSVRSGKKFNLPASMSLLYGVGLFTLEFMRDDVRRFAGITSVQLLLLAAVIVISAARLVVKHNNTTTSASVT